MSPWRAFLVSAGEGESSYRHNPSGRKMEVCKKCRSPPAHKKEEFVRFLYPLDWYINHEQLMLESRLWAFLDLPKAVGLRNRVVFRLSVPRAWLLPRLLLQWGFCLSKENLHHSSACFCPYCSWGKSQPPSLEGKRWEDLTTGSQGIQ